MAASRTMMESGVHFMSKRHDWTTPQDLFDALNREFAFTLDPCSTHENAKCAKHYTEAEDGLSLDWSGERVFMNPPYGRAIARWMKKADEESKRGALVVCLVPARTDTAWWHDSAAHHEVRFVRGRIRFGGGQSCAPFPSAIVVMRPVIISCGPDRAWKPEGR